MLNFKRKMIIIGKNDHRSLYKALNCANLTTKVIRSSDFLGAGRAVPFLDFRLMVESCRMTVDRMPLSDQKRMHWSWRLGFTVFSLPTVIAPRSEKPILQWFRVRTCHEYIVF